jgi:hypothetical protein
MESCTNWLLLINAALGSFLAGTASRIFAVSMPTIASSLNTAIADPGQSGHFRKRDEFYVLLDWNHGASGDRVLGHARNREAVSPDG